MGPEGEHPPGEGKWAYKNVYKGKNPDTGRKYFERERVWVPKKPGLLSVFGRESSGPQPVRLTPKTHPQLGKTSIDKRDAARNEHLLDADKYDR